MWDQIKESTGWQNVNFLTFPKVGLFFLWSTFDAQTLNLRCMRFVLSCILICFGSQLVAQQTVDDFFEKADNFFKRNVSDGLVDYTLIKNDPVMLNELVSMISETNSEELSAQNRKAFLINAYNILVIKGVCDHYPTKSVMDVPGFFKKKAFPWYGGTITLDKLEHELIQPKLDARVHFALVCGARTCPPLRKAAYRPGILDIQLDSVRYKTINAPNWFIIDYFNEQIMYPELLDWYEADFTKEQMEMRDYINQFRKEALDTDYDFEETYYDWTLNDSKLAGTFELPTFKSGRTPPEGWEPGKQMGEGYDHPNAGPNAKRNQRERAKAQQEEAERVQPRDGGKSNITTYTPSALLQKDQLEVKLFNNIYTQTAWFNGDGDFTELNGRQTYHTTLLSVLLGSSESARVNVGFDMNLKGTRVESDPKASPLNVFKFEDNSTNRWELASLGPKVKFSPFAKLKRLSIQSSFWIPVASDMEGTPWLDWQRLTWWNQIFFDKSVGDHWQFFTEADLMLRIPQNKETGMQFFTPLSAFVSYFPSNKATVYAMYQFGPQQQFTPNYSDSDGAYYMQYGFGGKYQLTKSLEIEVLFSDFFLGLAQGAGETYNVGLRYLR